jgi:hypothetical protein
MRKNPNPDADPADRPANAEAAADSSPRPDDHNPPSLVWPPVDDELNDWEVLQLKPTGHTLIEPMKFTPPAGSAVPPPAAERRPFTPPPTPAPYVPPEPIDDPVGETSLLPISSDVDLPETELIEPLSIQPTLPMPAVSGARAAAVPVESDDRTIVIPRPAGLTAKPEAPTVVAVSPTAPPDDTNSNAATRVLVAPAFAASVGHAPTVPVSALHRAARPTFGPRSPMEDTLPAGVTRELLTGDGDTDRLDTRPDDTAVGLAARGDTHPVPSPVARRAPSAPAGPPSPFSRVPSRSPQPAAHEAEPAPVSLAPPPLAFGPRVPSAAPEPMPSAGVGAAVAPGPSLPIPEPATRDLHIPTRPAPTSTRTKLLSIGGAVAALLLLALGVYQVLSMRSTSAAAPVAATLAVESSPSGASVAIDGTPRGKTPLRLELTEGRHALDVSLAGATRHVPLQLAGGTVTAHSFEFAPPAPATAADAAIEIRSEPAGARVLVDGTPRGVTPIVVTGLTAGRHEVQVAGPFAAVTKTVTLTARTQSRLIVTPARPAPTPDAERGRDRDGERPARAADTGYITIQSPIVLRIVRNGDFVGTSEDSRLSLPAGNQVIGLENESVGFRDVRTVEVLAGKVTPVPVTLPKGEISINARPWAEVFVDGSRIGETPVSQLSLPVGIHEIVFRHPEHGERRVSVVVKIGATGRAFTDFTK